MKNFILGTLAFYCMLLLFSMNNEYKPCKDRTDCKIYQAKYMTK